MKHVLIMIMAIMCSLASSDDAEARRRGFSFGSGKSSGHSLPVIVPIPRGGARVVFVKDLPDLKPFKHEGEHFDLGYKFGFFGGGEWVGYFKKSARYVELNQEVVTSSVLPLVGLTEADAPKRSAAGQVGVGGAWLAIVAAVAVLGLLRSRGLRRALFSGSGQRGSRTQEFDEAAADGMIRAALDKNRQQQQVRLTRAPAARHPVGAPVAVASTGPATFGRRAR